MKKLSLILITILLVITGCNSPFSVKSDNPKGDHSNLSAEYPFNSTTTVGDVKWIGRVIEPKNDQEKVPTYQLAKVDQSGKEKIMYESKLESLYPDISLSSKQAQGTSTVILSHYQGYPEGGYMTEVFFDKGKESVRLNYDHFWGLVNQVTLTYLDATNYKINLETDNECTNFVDEKEVTDFMKTDILGLKVISQNNTETFLLPKSKRVSCVMIDGTITTPTLKINDIQINSRGASIQLPGDASAYLSRNEETKNLEVHYD